MASNKTPKMSLLAQYDDLCRYTSVLTTGCEKDFKLFVEAQKKFFLKRKSIDSEIDELRVKIHCLETEKLRFETQLKHLRNVLITEVEKCKKLELEKNSMERQIALIKELLSDGNGIDDQTKERLVQLSTACSQQFLSRLTTIEESGSLLSSSDCDETDDFLDTNKTEHKSRSRTKCSTDPLKKQRNSEKQNDFEDELAFSEEIIPRKSTVTFRSSSEPTSTSPEIPPRQVLRSDPEQIKEHPINVRNMNMKGSRSSLPVGRYSTGGKLSRSHAFVVKTFIRSEKCNPCGKVIKFCKQALKCSDCRISCHPECKNQCPLPCVPVISTPVRGPLGTIADYTSSISPMIPSLIVHCVNEIEARGFNEIGLYRIPGSNREIKELKEKFLKGKNIPILNDIDIHVLCGTVKDFLISLKDSLITKAAWHNFADAANQKDNTRLNMLYNSVCDLPQPNKETLAFLVLHLQRIASNPSCKMTIEDLSKIFGPTIVGYSVSEPAESNMFMEIKQQIKIMEGLLKISSDSWENLLSVESSVFCSKMERPEYMQAPVTSRLGPIYSSQNSLQVRKTQLDPRKSRTSKTEKRQYFASPILKYS